MLLQTGELRNSNIGRLTLGVRRFSAKLVNFESRGPTGDSRADLRITIAEAVGAVEALAGRTSHDVGCDRGHAALHRPRVGHWNFFRVHAAVSTEDIAFNCCGVDFPL